MKYIYLWLIILISAVSVFAQPQGGTAGADARQFPMWDNDSLKWDMNTVTAFGDSINVGIDTLSASKVVFTGDSVGIRGDLDVDGDLNIGDSLVITTAGYSLTQSIVGQVATLKAHEMELSNETGLAKIQLQYIDNEDNYIKITSANTQFYSGATEVFRLQATGMILGNPVSTRITVTGSSNTITLTGNLDVDGTVINFINMPSDSTGLATGDLWFNSTTGAIHRKF